MAKLSISISDDDLRWLKRQAKRHHGGNLSAAISEQTRIARHHEALGELLDDTGAPHLTRAEADAVAAEIDGRALPAKRARRRAA